MVINFNALEEFFRNNLKIFLIKVENGRAPIFYYFSHQKMCMSLFFLFLQLPDNELFTEIEIGKDLRLFCLALLQIIDKTP